MHRVAVLLTLVLAGCSGPGAGISDSTVAELVCPAKPGVADQVVVHVVAEDSEAARAHKVTQQIANNGTLFVRNMDTYESWHTVKLDGNGCAAYALPAKARYLLSPRTIEKPNDGETCGWVAGYAFDFEHGIERVTLPLHANPCYHTDPGPP